MKCKELCETTIFCSHFIWDEKNCMIKKGTVRLSDPIERNSGVKCGVVFKKKVTLTKTKQLEKTLLDGNSLDFEEKTTSSDDCINICRNKIKNCQSLSFDASSNQCLFFDHENPSKIASDDHISITYIKAKGFERKKKHNS